MPSSTPTPNRKHPSPNLSASSGKEGPMERCITKSVEKSGEESPVERRTTKSLKAAAAIGSHGLFGGYSTKGKADNEKAVPGLKGTMVAEAAKHAASAAAAVKQAKKEEAAKQAEATATDGEDEEASQIWATESEDEEVPQMSAIEFLMTYKELPQFEVGLILRKPLKRTPFTDTQEYKDLLADHSVTQEDMDEAAAAHEAWQEHRIRFQEYVRSEYEAKGYVEVSEEYIAKRIEIEEYSKKLWEEGFTDFDNVKEEVAQ